MKKVVSVRQPVPPMQHQKRKCADSRPKWISMWERSNYYHPLGLAYYPDGAHDGATELEPGIIPPRSTSTCGDDINCPAPMYFIDVVYQGSHSNNTAYVPITSGNDVIGT